MSDPKRCFIALPVPDPWLELIEGLISELRKSVSDDYRFEPMDNLHITLRFLGEIDDGVRERVQDEIDMVTVRMAPRVTIGRLSQFERPDGLHIAYLGVEDPTNGWLDVAEDIDERMGKLPVAWIEGDHVPHITLGRPGPGETASREDDALMTAAIKSLNTTMDQRVAGLPSALLDTIVLHESLRSPDGVVRFPVLSTHYLRVD